jgi:predicted acyl esterase
MPSRLPTLALALALLPLVAACNITIRVAGFRFTTPIDGALVGEPAPGWALQLPSWRTDVAIRLDGVPVDPATWTAADREAHGSLAGVPPGLHDLTADVTLRLLFGGVPVHVTTSTSFEMAAPATFSVRESVEQLDVTHAVPGTTLSLLDPTGSTVDLGTVDDLGSLIFRQVAPGDGYRIATDGPPRQASRPLHVVSVEDSTPLQSFYDSQVLEPGYGYLTTRDGTKLSVFVSLPGPPEDGPYPVLVNYSGYDPSQPVGALSLDGFDLSFLCPEFPVLCDAPNAPEALLAGVLGFATVGVNMRGTGCSGGAYDFFEPLQLLDGYDAIETVAAQPWAGKVGMVGISYPGISQLFVASTRPPHLAAITPLAVIDGVDTTLNPGGIINDGFAIEWAQQVLDRADPYGHGWEQGRVDAGDTTCEENQLLHAQKVDIIAKAYAHPFYEPDVYDSLDPRTFVDRIDVPVFTSGAWQDEQTGNHFPVLWSRFTSAPVVKYTAYNGAHADGFSPQVLAEWKNFLDFYVRGAIVPVPTTIRTFAPLLFQQVFGVAVGLPAERFSPDEDFETQKAAYEAEPPIRILMDSGGLAKKAGWPLAGFELSFDSWPPPQTQPERFYFHEDGSLRPDPPVEAASASSFQYDDAKGQETYAVNDAFEKALPDIQWLPEQAGRQVAFVSDPLDQDLVVIGHASADLWIQSSASDADLEILVSEVRPDGMETYVGSGWLRASQRALSPESTPLRPVQTHLQADVAPLPPGEWTPVRVEIYPFGHVFRAGSQIRIAVSTPGGNKGLWKFDVLQLGDGVTQAVSHSAAYPSSVLLPVIPGIVVPTPLPPCPGLRSQPCRTYVPTVNTPFAG